MVAFFRVVGLLLALSFGTMFAVLYARDAMIQDLDRRLREEGRPVFVTITRAQQRSSVFGERYYYAYEGKLGADSFRSVEEVPYVFFHSYSEGRAVQAVAFQDSAGRVYSHLRGNPLPVARPFDHLRAFAAGAGGLGLVFALLGFTLRRPRPVDSPDAPWPVD